ncbi:MAG: hypothetical protein JFR38_11180 [Muribaculaceae bacterium]|nr:hypothetical protein [Muribaculaceae bacterium]
MLRYLPILVVIGLIFAIIFAAVDKLLIEKIADEKKRKYVKIASYVVLYFIAACFVVEAMEWAKQ